MGRRRRSGRFSRTPPFDLVVASEVLYEPSQYAALADALAFFATDAIIGYKVRHGREQTSSTARRRARVS